MANSKYDKYIVYRTPNNPFHPIGSFPGSEVISINANPLRDDITGAPQLNFAWWYGIEPESEAYKPHYHEVDEYVALLGSDPHDPWNLYGEVEWWFEDTKHMITQSCVIYIPAKLQHAPIVYRKVEKPILFMNVHLGADHPHHAVAIDDPKWVRFKDPRLDPQMQDIMASVDSNAEQESRS